jgi:hypothetical protein
VGSTSASTPRTSIEYLLADEAFPAAALRDPLGLDDLRRQEGRAAGVAHLPGADQVGQRAQSLVDVGRRVGPVDLVQVDAVGAQAAQAVLALPDDPAGGVSPGVHVPAHRAVHLGGEDDAVTARPFQRLADDLLRLPR